MKQGFFASFLDLSFTSFVTPRLVAVLYILGVVLAGIVAAIYVYVGSQLPGAQGNLVVILAPVMFVLAVIYWRALLEVMVVLFRINENVAQLAGSGPPTTTHQTGARPTLAGPTSVVTQAQGGDDVVEKLTRLKSLLDTGMISREDFEREKAKLFAG